jgi:hypothetical protein
MKKLIEAYEKYIALLGKSEASMYGIAFVHGYRMPQQYVERGEELRQEIAALKKQMATVP